MKFQKYLSLTITIIQTAFLSVTNLYAESNFNIQHFGVKDGFTNTHVSDVIQDQRGLIWVATWDGLFSYDGRKFRQHKGLQGENSIEPDNHFRSICELENGDIRCKEDKGTYIYHVNTQCFEVAKTNNNKIRKKVQPSFNSKVIISSLPEYSNREHHIMLEDRQRGIWISTHRGLDRVRVVQRNVTTRQIASSGEEYICGLFSDHQGRLWIADKNGFVTINNGQGQLISYLTPNGTLTNQRRAFGHNVYTIHETADKTIWFGTKTDGLFRLTPSATGYTITRFVHSDADKYSLSDNTIYDICSDKQGRLLVGTFWGGLNVMDMSNPGKFYSSDNIFKGKYARDCQIRNVVMYSDNCCLLGTNNGLVAVRLAKDISHSEFKTFLREPGKEKSLPNNKITRIIKEDGITYIATYGGGICKTFCNDFFSEKPEFESCFRGHNNAPEAVLMFSADRKGNLWVIGEKSVGKISLQSSAYQNFTHEFSIDDMIFSEAHPTITSSGMMVLGTTQGITIFNPQRLQTSNYVPPLWINKGQNIKLGADETTLSLEVSALDYNRNEEIIYRYRIKDTDSDWLYSTDGNININNVPAGSHVLCISSTNGDGQWVDNEIEINIYRTPHFNERPEAWMLYGMLTLIAVSFILYMLKLQRELRNVKLTTNEHIEYVGTRIKEIFASPEVSTEEKHDNPDAEFISRLNDFIDKRIYDCDLCIDEIAHHLGFSRSNFYLKMKRELDMAPNAYLMEQRMLRAEHLLRTNNKLNVSEVAYKCGFSEPKYFSRCFKKRFGKTPSDFR